MSEPTPRRTTSELDIRSLRRIGDALLLAQNRARRATDRANHTEHVLRLVLAQVDFSRIHVAHSLRRQSALFNDIFASKGAAMSMTSSSLIFSFCLENMAKDVVTNLNTAMTRHKRYVDGLTLPTLHFSLWNYKDRGFFGPMYFVAGLLAGVVVGIVLTKQWQLQYIHTHKETPSLFGKLTKWCSRYSSVAGTPWHLTSMPVDEYGFLTYPATFEVV
ncbi:unnamed protein product [Peronospora belbahrii]|uniref:Uncharacterized protein n=1 Tax=Peronospora belbahrii TaxID=622444 RepID=A0AAU9KQ72_9STRA|nr:unnamed protein product [Peronospora belbahrii]CAH0515624.1 unnamed protein product [Peronospora belbahrii]